MLRATSVWLKWPLEAPCSGRWGSPSTMQSFRQLPHARDKSNPTSADEMKAPTASEVSSTWWSSIRAVLFPVSSRATATTEAAELGGEKLESLMSPAALQRLQRARAAASKQRDTASSADAFIPLSADAEQFSGYLFKMAIFMISLPMAGWFVSKILLVALCIKGLQNPANLDVVKMSLARVRTFIFNDYLATRFEQDDGVTMLVSLLGHQGVLSNAGVMSECLSTIMHLLTYEETRSALLLGMATERLQRALDRGWVAESSVKEAKQVHRHMEAMKEQDMEATFGRAAGAK